MTESSPVYYRPTIQGCEAKWKTIKHTRSKTTLQVQVYAWLPITIHVLKDYRNVHN